MANMRFIDNCGHRHYNERFWTDEAFDHPEIYYCTLCSEHVVVPIPYRELVGEAREDDE